MYRHIHTYIHIYIYSQLVPPMCSQDLVYHWLTIIVFVKAYWLPILVTSHVVLCQALKPDMPKCNVPNTLPKSSAMTICGVQKSCRATVPWQSCKCHCGHPCHAQSQYAKASWLPIKPLWHPMLHFNTMVKNNLFFSWNQHIHGHAWSLFTYIYI